jgi:hypothetical protein
MQGGSAEKSGNLGYVFSMLKELRAMSEAEGSDVLTYFIEMAIIEAADEIHARNSKQIGRQQRNSAA